MHFIYFLAFLKNSFQNTWDPRWMCSKQGRYQRKWESVRNCLSAEENDSLKKNCNSDASEPAKKVLKNASLKKRDIYWILRHILFVKNSQEIKSHNFRNIYFILHTLNAYFACASETWEHWSNFLFLQLLKEIFGEPYGSLSGN